jgi:hypothetical protein
MTDNAVEILPNRTIKQLEGSSRQVITLRLVGIWKEFSSVIHTAQTRQHRNLNLEELQRLRESLTLVYTIAPARTKAGKPSEAWLRADKLIHFVDQQIKATKDEAARNIQERLLALRERDMELKITRDKREQQRHNELYPETTDDDNR